MVSYLLFPEKVVKYKRAVSDNQGGTAAERVKRMNEKSTSHENVRRLVFAAILTAIVVVLQLLGSFIRFGPFSVSLVLIPIVVGAALLGWQYGTWLGFVFAVTVLLSGDAAAFMVVNPFGTIVTVIAKGVLAGTVSGLVYSWLSRKHRLIGTVLSAVVCPVVNTGVFLIGCRIFFWETISEWAANANAPSAGLYAILTMVGLNFVFELLFNCVLSPVIVRLVSLGKKED